MKIAKKKQAAAPHDATSTIIAVMKWPAIGALIGGGILIAGHVLVPPIARNLAKDLGERAGEGFAEGWEKARETIAQTKRRLSIAGWGTYR